MATDTQLVTNTIGGGSDTKIPSVIEVNGEAITGTNYDEIRQQALESAKTKIDQQTGSPYDPDTTALTERTVFNNDGTYTTRYSAAVTEVDIAENTPLSEPPASDESNLAPVSDAKPSLINDPDDRDVGGGFNPAAGAVVTPPSTDKQPDNQSTKTVAKAKSDWRFRISLAPTSTYLYNASRQGDSADILSPLKATNGIIFPYTPQISMSYNANYDSMDIPHTNFKHHQYTSSEVGSISITADFTAQDTHEANYMLAVIHFFRSVTKMFYGKDQSPINGTPPPLCFLHGFGIHNFDNHPVLISRFNMTYPNDVDYIRAGTTTKLGAPVAKTNAPKDSLLKYIPGMSRLLGNNLLKGATGSPPPAFTSLSNSDATMVPTKMQITLECLPVVTRADIARNFSVNDYATGKLYSGTRRGNKGGIW